MRYLNICFFFSLILLTGCVSNYNLAVIREAREFALEKHPDLSDKSMHVVQFYTPKLESNLVYSRDGSGASKQDIVQTVVVWDLPEPKGYSLMVVGYGERELHNWSPNRTILKRFRVFGGPPKAKKKKSKPKKKPSERKPNPQAKI